MSLSADNIHFSFEAHGGFIPTSPATPEYNCIAWAAEDTDAWWWPDENGVSYWPPGVARESTVDAFVEAFATLGYSRCDNDALEEGFEKVAIYEMNTGPTHAARQVVVGSNRGKWTSKMGRNIDIVHDLLGVSGSCYGEVAAILRRPAK